MAHFCLDFWNVDKETMMMMMMTMMVVHQVGSPQK